METTMAMHFFDCDGSIPSPEPKPIGTRIFVPLVGPAKVVEVVDPDNKPYFRLLYTPPHRRTIVPVGY